MSKQQKQIERGRYLELDGSRVEDGRLARRLKSVANVSFIAGALAIGTFIEGPPQKAAMSGLLLIGAGGAVFVRREFSKVNTSLFGMDKVLDTQPEINNSSTVTTTAQRAANSYYRFGQLIACGTPVIAVIPAINFGPIAAAGLTLPFIPSCIEAVRFGRQMNKVASGEWAVIPRDMMNNGSHKEESKTLSSLPSPQQT